MGSQDEGAAARREAIARVERASLQIELQAAEPQVLAIFREGILRWLNDRSGSAFARIIGVPDRLTFEESPSGTDPRAGATVRLRVSWCHGRGASLPRALVRSADDTVPAGLPVHAPALEHFVFFPDPHDAVVPMFRTLSVPLGPDALQPSFPAGPGIGIGAPGPALIEMGRRLAVFLTRPAIQVRVPARGSLPFRGGAMLGAAAIVAAVLVGSVYVAAPHPAAPERRLRARRVAAQQTAVTTRAADARTVTPVPVALRGAPELPDHARPAGAAPVVAGRAAGLPDTEAANRPRLAARAAGGIPRPHPIEVRAVTVPSAAAIGPRRGTGALLVRSEPAGAAVSINGILHGRTPLTIRGLNAGSRVLRLDLPGYRRWSWAIPVAADKQTPVNVKLQPEIRPAGAPDED